MRRRRRWASSCFSQLSSMQKPSCSTSARVGQSLPFRHQESPEARGWGRSSVPAGSASGARFRCTGWHKWRSAPGRWSRRCPRLSSGQSARWKSNRPAQRGEHSIYFAMCATKRRLWRMSFSRADESPARRAAKVRISSCGLSGRGKLPASRWSASTRNLDAKKLQQGQQHTEHLQNRSPIQYERGKRVQNRFLLVEKGSLWQDEYMTGEQCYPKALRGLFRFGIFSAGKSPRPQRQRHVPRRHRHSGCGYIRGRGRSGFRCSRPCRCSGTCGNKLQWCRQFWP